MAQEVRSTTAPAKSALAHVPFHGDDIEAAKDSQGKVWVSVRRVCEALEIDSDTQRVKLKGKPWAVTGLIPATGPDGKTYEVFAVDLDSLPMWLATIDPKRVKPAARAKLADYQRECAKVLRDYFFGVETPRQPGAMTEEQMLESCLGATPTKRWEGLSDHENRVADLVQMAIGRNLFTEKPMAVQALRQMARDLAMLGAALKEHFSPEGASFVTENDIKQIVATLAQRAEAIALLHETIERADAGRAARFDVEDERRDWQKKQRAYEVGMRVCPDAGPIPPAPLSPEVAAVVREPKLKN
jgi:hypothetical protein